MGWCLYSPGPFLENYWILLLRIIGHPGVLFIPLLLQTDSVLRLKSRPRRHFFGWMQPNLAGAPWQIRLTAAAQSRPQHFVPAPAKVDRESVGSGRARLVPQYWCWDSDLLLIYLFYALITQNKGDILAQTRAGFHGSPASQGLTPSVRRRFRRRKIKCTNT